MARLLAHCPSRYLKMYRLALIERLRSLVVDLSPEKGGASQIGQCFLSGLGIDEHRRTHLLVNDRDLLR